MIKGPPFRILELKTNIRSNDEEFSKFLLKIGDGEINPFIVPDNWKVDDVCKTMYGNINEKVNNHGKSVILAVHNEDTKQLNEKVLEIINSEEKIYYSIDYATYKGVDKAEQNVHLDYPIEHLHSIMKEGLPPHELKLKVGAIVMLIRNLSIRDGLCNGTRLKIISLFKYNIKAEIITGDRTGDVVFIPRITLNTTESSSLPFILYRKQFPIVLAFAMTINKSQGQSFESVGLFYRRPLFSHGQLYVALSRCRDPKKIYVENVSLTKDCIENIVWKEIFNN